MAGVVAVMVTIVLVGDGNGSALPPAWPTLNELQLAQPQFRLR